MHILIPAIWATGKLREVQDGLNILVDQEKWELQAPPLCFMKKIMLLRGVELGYHLLLILQS